VHRQQPDRAAVEALGMDQGTIASFPGARTRRGSEKSERARLESVCRWIGKVPQGRYALGGGVKEWMEERHGFRCEYREVHDSTGAGWVPKVGHRCKLRPFGFSHLGCARL